MIVTRHRHADPSSSPARPKAVGSPWSASIGQLPPEERTEAWKSAMRHLQLPFRSWVNDTDPTGSVHVLQSPLGLQFALVEADAQIIAGRIDHQTGDGMWLAMAVSGSGTIIASDLNAPVGRDMLLCGVSCRDASLTLTTRHKLLMIRIPQTAIGPRLIASPEMPVTLIDATQGLTRIFYKMLETVANEHKHLDCTQLGPVELAVIDFLVASVANVGGARSRGGAEGARANQFYQILQRLETMLGDPELSIDALADDVGYSVRHIRGLFAASQQNFGAYIKARRLERCFADLISPVHRQLSIVEIAFRWGFNDSAHFSRSFRAQFGKSPRDHRRSIR